MKMKLFFRISVLALCISMSLSSFAQDQQDRISVEDINWSANNQSLETIVSTPDKPGKIYLYATTPKKFVTVGGRYGAQPILAEVGMNFYVEKVADDNHRYYIHSWVDNPTTSHENGSADYLGVKPTMVMMSASYLRGMNIKTRSPFICLWIVESLMPRIIRMRVVI